MGTELDKSHMVIPTAPTAQPQKETVGWGAWYFLAIGIAAYALLNEYLYREQQKRR
jgi:hypothetical protein